MRKPPSSSSSSSSFSASFSPFYRSSPSFWASSGILSKQDQGKAAILRDSERPLWLPESNT